MKPRIIPKTKLTLAMASVLAGSAALSSGNAIANATLNNDDGLGDAAIFQYFTAKDNWQTFFRLINTSADVVVVKVRFREAANSREILDFEVALSPYDMWAGWTDKDALGDGSGPGIRSTDTSCVFPLPDKTPPGETGWETIDASRNLIGALFKDTAFTGDYADGSAVPVLDRLSEGHFEVIGMTSFPSDGTGNGFEDDFAADVTHAANGKPESCQAAYNKWQNANFSLLFNIVFGRNVPNVIGANAYLINVPNGQGAGYDPEIFRDCTFRNLREEALVTDTNPDLDSCDATQRFGIGPRENNLGVGPVAVNQQLWDGTFPPPVSEPVYRVDLNSDGDYDDSFPVDLNQNGVCTGDELTVMENDAPQALYDAAVGTTLVDKVPGTGGCQYAVVTSGGGGCSLRVVPPGEDPVPCTTQATTEDTFQPWRLKQKGRFTQRLPDGTVTNAWPVTGGVDNVSEDLMRTAVINEWAASYNPGAAVEDYFTQWVVTFPTKHYYVDLQNDPKLTDDVSPTLVRTVDEAFAPFWDLFQAGANPGKSCEPFWMQMWDREEAYAAFTSPGPDFGDGLCHETNVVTFNERYTSIGLASAFSYTVNALNLPNDAATGEVAERGWAKMQFTGPGTGWDWTTADYTWQWGGGLYSRVLGDRLLSVQYGLPVTGFLFSVYNTVNGSVNNHTAVNAHKYERDSDLRLLPPDMPEANGGQ